MDISVIALSAAQLTSGTIPDDRFPATLPAISGANLTNLPAAGASVSANNTWTGDQTFEGKITFEKKTFAHTPLTVGLILGG